MTKRERNLIFFAVLLVIVFGLYSVINHYSEKLEVLETENESLEAQKEEIDIKLGFIDSLTESLETNQTELAELKDSIQDNITDEETDTVFTDLAKANSITVNSLTITNGTTFVENSEVDFSNIQMKQVAISAQGTNTQFSNFIDDINARGDILVASVSQSDSDENDSYQITCIIFMEKAD